MRGGRGGHCSRDGAVELSQQRTRLNGQSSRDRAADPSQHSTGRGGHCRASVTIVPFQHCTRSGSAGHCRPAATDVPSPHWTRAGGGGGEGCGQCRPLGTVDPSGHTRGGHCWFWKTFVPSGQGLSRAGDTVDCADWMLAEATDPESKTPSAARPASQTANRKIRDRIMSRRGDGRAGSPSLQPAGYCFAGGLTRAGPPLIR
jgi:hypothetical protein